MSQQNFADRKASCERRVAFTLQNTFLKRCQVSGGGQDININITSVARKYFKHQRSSQCQISQMTQAVWHLQNVWTKMHTLIRKYFWYLSNVLFAKNKVHTGFLMVLPAVKITISQNQNPTTSSTMKHSDKIMIYLSLILKSRLHQAVDVTFCKLAEKSTYAKYFRQRTPVKERDRK